MSILNCNTNLTVQNCTGLETTLHITPASDNTKMRVQPLDNADIKGSIQTNAGSIVDWIKEWIQLVSYGPTHQQMDWIVPASSSQTVRFKIDGPFKIEMRWSDPSVSWASMESGHWSIDISKAIDVTLFIRSDLGEYVNRKTSKGPRVIQSVRLKPFMELACDDEIPFKLMKEPKAVMYWRQDLNLQAIVNPDDKK